jgi:hypothetical protein
VQRSLLVLNHAVLNNNKGGPARPPRYGLRVRCGLCHGTREVGQLLKPHVESKLPLSSLKHARKKGNGGGHPLGGLSFYSRIRCELPRATSVCGYLVSYYTSITPTSRLPSSNSSKYAGSASDGSTGCVSQMVSTEV